MRKILLSLILPLYSINVSAVTMEEALVKGYSNNEELKIIRTDFLDEIEAFPRALAGFMPKITANINSSNSRVESKSGLPNNQLINSKTNRYTQSIILDQPIFDGWSSVAELKAAQSAFRSARGKYYAQEQEIFLKEIDAYLTCFEAKQKYEISKTSVKSNKTQLEAMTEKFKLGEATETEVASAREGLATTKSNEAVAKARYESAKANFYQVFGIEATDVKMPALPKDLPTSLEILIERATAVNPYVESAMHATKSSKATEYARKGALLPKVSFRAENGNTHYNPQQVGGQYNNKSTTATLSVNIPILTRGGMEYSDIRRAKYQTKKAVINLDKIIKQITSNSKEMWAEFEAAKLRIKATDEAVRAAEIAYEGMRQEEMLGSKTVVDVLLTEERLHRAKEVRVEAQKALILSAYKMKSLVGELTARSMNLKVDYFSPENEFKKAKMKVIGF